MADWSHEQPLASRDYVRRSKDAILERLHQGHVSSHAQEQAASLDAHLCLGELGEWIARPACTKLNLSSDRMLT